MQHQNTARPLLANLIKHFYKPKQDAPHEAQPQRLLQATSLRYYFTLNATVQSSSQHYYYSVLVYVLPSDLILISTLEQNHSHLTRFCSLLF